MKKRIYAASTLIVVILVTALSLNISQLDTITPTIEHTVKLLSSDEFMGRQLGTLGNDMTVEYITKIYEELDLTPFDEDYYHESKQTIYPPDKQEHYMEVVFKDGTSLVCEYGKDYIEFPFKHCNVSASITTDPEDPDLENKILVLRYDQKEYFYKAKAKGILLAQKSLFKLASMLHYLKDPKAYITQDLYNQLTSKEVEFINFKFDYEPTEIYAKSVVGKIEGVNKKKAVVLSAHFDHVGWAGDTIFPGTIDNASGTAILLETARQLQEYAKNHTFQYDIFFAAFNGEDSYLFCSADFIEDLEKEYDELYDINIDCVGMIGGGELTLSGLYNDDTNTLNTTLKEALISTFTENDLTLLDEFDGLSDHMHFNRKGYAGVTVGQKNIMGEEGGPSIHTPDDNPSIANYSVMQHCADILKKFVIKYDGTIFGPTDKQ